ncbi:uncharacterized protein HMPREF1541_00136 [Cyphellophora europaea CBS 101466]|uniref:WSC domain-containing protein n=1 Tax=Cyphellophora europaea (strain CBS 101466) TaxID=1220924 RepID=W2SDJ0_CYPE1|nr:uncharacterized protein HMPREF1541_00136 [Cyphellophora europaea CBS 101466]ETN45954.1 hypothetical protein HMPREF1541_00136 [Cyphellophora europaea CBS 101466]
MMATSIRFASSLVFILFACLTTSEAGTLVYGNSPSRRSLQRSDLSIAGNLPGQWTSKGCYADSVGNRALAAKSYTDDGMTEESCVNFCNTVGYAFAGVEYSRECYCSNFIGASGQTANAGDCNMPCGGNSTEACGGPNRLNVFHNDAITAKPTGPATNAGPPGWGFVGCYTDSNMTVANCVAVCAANGYTISGVEYSGECYCGNTFSNGGAPAPDGLAGCNMICNGNSSEYCGGPNRLDVYVLGARSIIAPDWAPLGCYTDSVTARTLSVGMPVPGGPANMTQENCQQACFASNYNISGVEYSQECYCDNQYRNGGGPAADGTAGCNMNCNGNTDEVCGGPNRLNVFTYVGRSPSATTTSALAAASTQSGVSTVQTTSSSTAPATTPTSAAQLPGNWTYRGCYIDNANGRILMNELPDNDALTIENCVQTCASQGMTVVGLEYSKQCFCGSSIINAGTLANADSDCAMTCSGNSSEVCGGSNRMSIFATGNMTILPVPTIQRTNLPANWAYQGCLNDNGNSRVLPHQIDMRTNMTATNCLALCGQFGYSAAGLEYGQQCFCGDDTDRIASGATYQPDAQWSFPCSGDPTTLCGAGLLLSYYTQPPVDVWQFPTGNGAGVYEFLIGGTVIPLITSANRNGKVTFVEKHGTGPPNSTGAYELDLSAIDSWDVAWREVEGLRTDVFCSAGLTLPDKGARIINIGGWSDDSTYGVRFLTPDGSPGVPGQSVWQENVDEISLQVGRWYPSAMMMANGSILVVGGENGSNGPPVPNLEIIPKPPGGSLVYCDWLQRTDPYNLYPFMAVLPSGGILASYYNEARILDEATLQTVRTLPNIPGSVTSFLAGRTYPLEGTSMILPQSYPWTDPLTVLICGGSTPYAGDALDNCVSIQPEVPGANWAIERMPSKRVMSSMVALPDGTFLIMNGAQQGVAGFGLGDNPNLNALLYDPSKPVHNRISSLANTTVARMYHNEAILLMDGRVLVSGSDPENLDGKYPQEYRVEVFIPPYLMGLDEPLALNVSDQVLYHANAGTAFASNATASDSAPYTYANGTNSSSVSNGTACGARPIFNLALNNTDWSYGATYTFTMHCGGTPAKVSLMGAVSSTHGNSMGARTLFPAFSCGTDNGNGTSTGTSTGISSSTSNSNSNSTSTSTGTSCTVTAPPNAHVAGGPAWFMMFVIGGNGVPSVAEWVRIGGDPGGLGSWPAFEDFTTPGS